MIQSLGSIFLVKDVGSLIHLAIKEEIKRRLHHSVQAQIQGR